MDLLERYLQAIGRYLPEAVRTDTLAELRTNLLEQMDARAEELGRPLTDGEVAAVLKEHGNPAMVALRYLPQQSLIGPTVFPFYMLTLKRGLPFVALVSAFAAGVNFIATQHASLADALLRLVGEVVQSLCFAAAIITLVFAGIEYAIRMGRYGAPWNSFDPSKLPAVEREKQDYGPKSYTKRVAGLVMHCLWMVWVISLSWKLVWHVGSGAVGIILPAGWGLTPMWHTFYALLLVILSLQLIAKIVRLRSEKLRWMDFVTDSLAILAIAWLAHANDYFVATAQSVNPEDLISANQGVGLALRIVLLLSVFGLGKKVWKYFRQRQGTTMLAF